jgi:hypothetical protein
MFSTPVHMRTIRQEIISIILHYTKNNRPFSLERVGVGRSVRSFVFRPAPFHQSETARGSVIICVFGVVVEESQKLRRRQPGNHRYEIIVIFLREFLKACVGWKSNQRSLPLPIAPLLPPPPTRLLL